MKLLRFLLLLALSPLCLRAGSPPALAPADYRVLYVRASLTSPGHFFVVPVPQTRNAVQLANKIFDSTNSALRINAVAMGGGGSPAADNPNLDQLFNRFEVRFARLGKRRQQGGPNAAETVWGRICRHEGKLLVERVDER